ncbi:MAG: EamA/RhaT family transporter [Aquaticitalea sp.]
MIYILLSILCSTLIFIVFKLLDTFKIDASKAIVINYIAAFAFGVLTSSKSIQIEEIVTEKWFYGAIILGVLFIVIFNVMAITAQKNGLSVASVAAKMSVVIPVVFGVIVYKEHLTLALTIGIILALFSVYLTSSKSNTVKNLKRNLVLPIFLFIGSGVIDTTIKYLQTNYMTKDGVSVFSATLFNIAAVVGILQLAIQKKLKLDFKTVIAGFLLGLVNFGSLYFIIKSLQLDNWSSATVFTLNNVGIVMTSTLVGKFIFKEHLLPKNWIGIAIAIVAICIITITV